MISGGRRESRNLAADAVVLRGQRAWLRIKVTAAEQRQLWREVGEALNYGRSVVGAGPRFDLAFSDWCSANGFGDIGSRVRSDAMWLAANWIDLSTAWKGPDTHPTHIRAKYVKDQKALDKALDSVARVALLDETPAPSPELTLEPSAPLPDLAAIHKQARKIHALANSVEAGDATAKRRNSSPPMPSTSVPGRVYKTTLDKRAKGVAWRQANLEKSRSYSRAQAERKRSTFVGPRRPRGRQPLDLTAEERTERRRQQYRAVYAERIAKFRAQFIGPPKPPRVVAPKPSKTPATSKPPQAVQEARKGPRKPREAVVVPDAPQRSPEPSRTTLAATTDTAAEKAGRKWDRESIKVLRKATSVIREQVREAAQIAAKSRTPEQIAAARAGYEAAMRAMSQWSADQRQTAEDRRNAFRRRADAEADRSQRLADTMTSAAPAVADLAALMRAPARPVSYTRNP